MDVPPAAVTVRLAQPAERAAVYLPSQSAEPVEATDAPTVISLSVGDELMVVEITPGVRTDDPETEALLSAARPAPNPSRGRTVVPFALSAPATVSLDVFDVLGRQVWAGRLDAASGPGGPFVVVVEGWAPGTYLTRLTAVAGERTETLAGRLTVR